MRTLYFDSAATTPVRHEVLEAMLPYFSQIYYNPNSAYEQAHEVKKRIEEAREVIARSINALPEEIYFTSGGSEANCAAIQGFINSRLYPRIITTPVEHHSTLAMINSIFFTTPTMLPISKTGVVTVDAVAEAIRGQKPIDNVLVSIIGANNEVGTVQDLCAIGCACQDNDAIFHVDGVQMYGHIPVDVKKMHIDMFSASAHKIGGPKGVGFLYINRDIDIAPIIFGTQERGQRGGTTNVPGVIGFAEAVKYCNTENTDLEAVRDYMIERLEEECGCTLNGSRIMRLPNNVNVTFPKGSAQSMVITLGEMGILCSAGSACNEGTPDPSHVLKAIGLSDEEAGRTVRFTLPEDTTTDDVDLAIEVIKVAEEMVGGK